MEIATIGFTRTSAESFFGRLQEAGVTEVWDIRLNNTSQLAGFAKRDDIAYFLRIICEAGYRPVAELMPEEELLRAYRARAMSTSEWEWAYLDLIRSRRAESLLHALPGQGLVVLLCSEDRPDHCHRRLAAEYLQSHDPRLAIRHL